MRHGRHAATRLDRHRRPAAGAPAGSSPSSSGSCCSCPASGCCRRWGPALGRRAGRNDDGFLYSASDNFSTQRVRHHEQRAIDLATGADWLPVSAALGNARIQVTGANGSDVFVGIAPVADADRYLGGVDRTIDHRPGLRLAAGQPHRCRGAGHAAGEQNFWVAQASGSRHPDADLEAVGGNWTLVVMNTDGSAGVSVDARIGATVPALGGLAWGC